MIEENGLLKIDAEFRRLVFPCSQAENAALEQKILRDGCTQPIVTWCGYIIRGFEQYNICVAHGITFETKKMSFCVREEVISLICREELNTRSLPENQWRYLIGKCCNANVIIGAHNAAGTDWFKERVRRELSKGKNLYENSVGRTRERLAEEYHLNKCTVARYAAYARAIDYIASINAETAKQILAGEIKILLERIIECDGKTEEEVTKLLTMPRQRVSTKISDAMERETETCASVKDMPAFDPDAEINSLALTIPSWVSSIERTRSMAKFAMVTPEGKNRLEQELHKLQNTAEEMLHALKGVC